jgi:hypothetical protein
MLVDAEYLSALSEDLDHLSIYRPRRHAVPCAKLSELKVQREGSATLPRLDKSSSRTGRWWWPGTRLQQRSFIECTCSPSYHRERNRDLKVTFVVVESAVGSIELS